MEEGSMFFPHDIGQFFVAALFERKWRKHCGTSKAVIAPALSLSQDTCPWNSAIML
jgi:hypothetical protein